MPPSVSEIEVAYRTGRISHETYMMEMARNQMFGGGWGLSSSIGSAVVSGPIRSRKKKTPFKPGDKFVAVDTELYDGETNAAYIKVTSIDDDGEVYYNIFDESDNELDSGSANIKNAQVKKYVLPKKKTISLSSVIMSDDKREQILAAISQVEHHKTIFEKWGFSETVEKGKAVSLLFWGGPGTGKTLTAQAIADTLGLKLKIIQTAEVESSEPGQCERNIKAFFENAEKQKQLLLFDECDSLIHDRSEVGMILGGQINALLTALEHFAGVVIFTTNRLGKMDPAFERRVSAKIEFENPTEEQRAAIWRRLIPKKAPICSEVRFEVLAKVPLPGGNIKNAVLSAARYAAFKGKKKIDAECFTHAIEKEYQSLKGFERALRDRPNTPRLGVSDMRMEEGARLSVAPARQQSVDFSTPPSPSPA